MKRWLGVLAGIAVLCLALTDGGAQAGDRVVIAKGSARGDNPTVRIHGAVQSPTRLWLAASTNAIARISGTWTIACQNTQGKRSLTFSFHGYFSVKRNAYPTVAGASRCRVSTATKLEGNGRVSAKLLAAVKPPPTPSPSPSQSPSPSPTPDSSVVKINQIYYNSPGDDDGSNASLNEEWISLTNTGGSSISLGGWTIEDAASHVYTFPSLSLGVGVTVRVHTGSGSNTSTDLYWGSGWYIWNNDGDAAYLVNSSATTTDTCSYSDPGERYAEVTCSGGVGVP
jgi:hypothetical protein